MKRYMLSFSFMMILVGIFFIGLLSRSNETGVVSNGNVPRIESQKIHVQKDGVDVYYPQIISGGTAEDRDIWNKIITDDLDKIMNIYSFQPYPTPEKGQSEIPTVLSIDYELKSQVGRFYSILYKARYSSSFVAHPTELVYTTNIDLTQNRRLALKDLIGLDERFIKEFRRWSLVEEENLTTEWKEAVVTYLKDMTDQDLLQGFQKADVIGSGNVWGVYSYITSDGIGISLSVPHYLGDHLEFEHKMKLRSKAHHSNFVIS